MHCFRYILPFLYTVVFWQSALSQTLLEGNILSASGEAIPEIYVTVIPPGPADIFTDHRSTVKADQNGFFRAELTQKGLYSIRFNGIYHKSSYFLLLADGQPSLRFTIYLIPHRFNEGEYFVNDDYLKWIRVTGNFNEYDYMSGFWFHHADDGSIFAFIPAQTDTLRYQIRGLSYGSGSHPHPDADGYNLREDGTFESVLHTGLPADSVEIRYTPRQTMPYQEFYRGLDLQGTGPLSAFIVFENPDDRHWVMPLMQIRRFPQTLMVIENPNESQVSMANHFRLLLDENKPKFPYQPDRQVRLNETEKFILDETLTETQHGLLYLLYASLLQQHQIYSEYRAFLPEPHSSELPEYDRQILMKIPDTIHPTHPAWAINRTLPGFLLQIVPDYAPLAAYLSEIIALHPADGVAEQAAIDLFRATALDYESADRVPAFRLALNRFGDRRIVAQLRHLFNTEIDGEGM
ncbi:carboxypeptidase-like regulatory domain-containing protein [Rhodohalobacter mucosus]|uniref:Uncharacterized protein n=1 Tax=Rhodohalobacter mucosus TaxID=2079485 RepID=A0A316TRU6_9BACT|nr:carboxypeptidase-like regulatory domain-containing protein [Rhodohalobacter mucosus]PWN05735.1 hypothetical protein DDZ15_14210 [Rhodohalobacter mucosus]